MTSILEVEQLDTLSSNASSTLTIGGTNTTTIAFGPNVTTTPSSLANTPAFSVNLGSNQVLSNNVVTKILLDTEEYDTDSAFASNKFTVPTGKGGKYAITLNIYWSLGNTESASELRLQLYKNGSALNREWISFNPSGRLTAMAQTLKVDLDLSAGDYLEMYALGYTGGASITAVDTQTKMSGFRIIGA